MSDSETVISIVDNAASRVLQEWQLGKVNFDEAVSNVQAKIWNDLIHHCNIESVPHLPDAGRWAAEVLDEWPLIAAAVWQALIEWIPRSLSSQIHNAPADQKATVEEVAEELNRLRENEVANALSSRHGDAACFATIVDHRISPSLARQISDEFPLTQSDLSSSPEMRFKSLLLRSLIADGSYREAAGEAGSLPTASQRAVACDSIVWAHYFGPRSTEPLPDVVVSLINSIDWDRAPDHLDSLACALLQYRRDLVVDLLARWTMNPGNHRGDGREYHRVASVLAWIAGDDELALSIALRDAAPLGVSDEQQVNPAADFVLGQTVSDTEERVDRLLRFSHMADRVYSERALVDAATLILSAGHPLEAAFVFTYSSRIPYGLGIPGLDDMSAPWLMEAFRVDQEEKIELLKALQAAGVPGIVQFDGLSFDGTFGQGANYYCPGSLAALRAGLARWEDPRA